MLQAGEVAGSIPNDVFSVFNWHNSSGRTMSAYNLNEYQEYFMGVKAAGS